MEIDQLLKQQVIQINTFLIHLMNNIQPINPYNMYNLHTPNQFLHTMQVQSDKDQQYHKQIYKNYNYLKLFKVKDYIIKILQEDVNNLMIRIIILKYHMLLLNQAIRLGNPL